MKKDEKILLYGFLVTIGWGLVLYGAQYAPMPDPQVRLVISYVFPIAGFLVTLGGLFGLRKL
jgi:hypothetical protein